MPTVLQLESFDFGTAEQLKAAALEPPEGYQAGYVAGLAAAEAKMMADQTNLKESLVASVTTGLLTQQQAETDVVKAITPLIDAMLATILPALLDPALHTRLRDIVQEALAVDAHAILTLQVAPSAKEAMTLALADVGQGHVLIEANPDLSEGAAWVLSPRGETSIDFDAALAEIRDTFIGVTSHEDIKLTETS